MSLGTAMNFRGSRGRITYSSVGVNRVARERSREAIASRLYNDSVSYRLGRPIHLPFGLVYPAGFDGKYFDLQIEGVGTKTLLAELTGRYETIGIDAVAMAVNDVIRSGSRPVLISDAIHISRPDLKVGSLIKGVRAGAKLSDCILASGETGNVSEILHAETTKLSPPFDLIVSCLGSANRPDLIKGDISEGDSIIGLGSSGIHSNGLTLARKILLRPWGGLYDPWFKHDIIGREIVEELLVPTAIYAKGLAHVQRGLKIKGAIHITGDGFSKFRRLLTWQRKFKQSKAKIGFKFELLKPMPAIFRLIFEAAKIRKTPISIAEMFRTFNMGYGFAIIVAQKDADRALDSL
ncbi:MAG: hypothetical protein JRN20_14305, partial [Nitrososphaerota archaeon]|nr:hypothetical protein [Nitrososphaerota archaeon]